MTHQNRLVAWKRCGSLSIQLPSSKLQIPDSCLFFQVPAHLHTFYFLPTHNSSYIYYWKRWPVKSCKLWGRFCGQNKVKSAKKKKIDLSCGCVRCPQGSFSEYYIFFLPPTRETLIILCMSPQKSIFPDSSLFMLFLGLSLKWLGRSHIPSYKGVISI